MAKNTRSNVYEGGLAVDPTVGPGVAATIGAILPRVNTTELWQKFGALNTEWVLISTGGNFPPSRIAVVDPTRGNDAVGAFGGPAYATIAAALAAAPALTPSTGNPCSIWIAPGTYVTDLDLVSNCHMVGMPDRGTVTIDGTVTWAAGAGVNAPQANLDEGMNFSDIDITEELNANAVAKTGGIANLYNDSCSMNDFTFTGRTGSQDTSWSTNGQVFQSTSLSNGIHRLCDMILDDVGPSGDALVQMQACQVLDVLECLGASTTNFDQSVIGPAGGTNVQNTAFLRARNSAFNGLAVDALASADIRTSEYGSIAGITGPGPIDRTNYRFTFGPTAAGANVLVFSALVPAVPDYLNNAYSVAFQSTGPVAASPVLNAKAATGLTFNDVGGITYEITITKE